jgi:hypothetical protein
MPPFSLITRQSRDLTPEGAEAKVETTIGGPSITFAALVGAARNAIER